MDETDILRSKKSQESAAQSASLGEFVSQIGWKGQSSPPLSANEDEKLTIIRTMKASGFRVRGRNKVMASITSPILQSSLSLSGWKDDHSHLPIIQSSV